MAKTRTEKIDSLQTEIAQLENKRKQLIQEQKQQERKDRKNAFVSAGDYLKAYFPTA
jgi:FtsZ-binding cell division protein ZapB